MVMIKDIDDTSHKMTTGLFSSNQAALEVHNQFYAISSEPPPPIKYI